MILDRAYVGIALLVPLLALAPGAGWADTYNGSISSITWNNNYVGTRTSTDSNAQVELHYLGGGAFTITVVMSGTEPGLGSYTFTGTGSGTITGGVATATINWSGTIAGSYSCTNNGGVYTGAVTGGSGTKFAEDEVLQLQDFNAGTVSPPIAGQGNWNHLITDGGTSLVFKNYVDVDDWMLYAD